jgi:hypothetical protein
MGSHWLSCSWQSSKNSSSFASIPWSGSLPAKSKYDATATDDVKVMFDVNSKDND